MIIGQRGESVEDKNKRHINEMEEDVEGWRCELEYAKKKCDKRYETYCVAMINICENTIVVLKEFQDSIIGE